MTVISVVTYIIAGSMLLVGGYTVWNGLRLSHSIKSHKKA